MPKGSVNNHIGEIFGDWKVVSKEDTRKLNCECTTCGFIKSIDKFSLKNGKSLTCKHNLEYTNCIGNKYYEWEVIAKGKKSGTLLCRCSCGNIREIYKARLLNNNTKSCGHTKFKVVKGTKYGKLMAVDDLGCRTWRYKCDCNRTEIFNTNTIRNGKMQCTECDRDDKETLLGKHIGDWEVLKRHENGYLCKCSCGTVRKILSYQLRNKTSTSCGHSTTGLIDITNNIYGKLKVIKYIGGSKWECNCLCGNKHEANSNSLRTGRTTSCGCDIREKVLNTRLNKYGETCMYGKDTNKREKWQIEAVFNQLSMKEYIESIGYKPTSFDLSARLGINTSNILKKIHKYLLEDIVEIAPLQSNKEKELKELVSTLYNMEISYNDRSIITPYELDIYIPKLKLAIEFNGNYWHSTYIKDEKYHQDKTIRAAKSGIQLIHIFEYEWDNYREKIIQLLKCKLQVNETKIECRDTNVHLIDLNIANEFLNKYHLQASTLSDISIGYIYKGLLIGVMAFRKIKFDTEYELIRLCWREGVTIIGGTEKMFEVFKKLFKPEIVTTYCDVTKFTGNIYIKLGFTVPDGKNSLSTPNYKWVSHSGKSILEDGFDTDDVRMSTLDYMKIYDSGSLKFIWRYNNVK